MAAPEELVETGAESKIRSPTVRLSWVIRPLIGRRRTAYSHRSPEFLWRCPATLIPISEDVAALAKHARVLPPRMASQTSLVSLRGFPSRTSLTVNP
jgi:hypothetical protein